jgi:hypothetical protein
MIWGHVFDRLEKMLLGVYACIYIYCIYIYIHNAKWKLKMGNLPKQPVFHWNLHCIGFSHCETKPNSSIYHISVVVYPLLSRDIPKYTQPLDSHLPPTTRTNPDSPPREGNKRAKNTKTEKKNNKYWWTHFIWLICHCFYISSRLRVKMWICPARSRKCLENMNWLVRRTSSWELERHKTDM